MNMDIDMNMIETAAKKEIQLNEEHEKVLENQKI